MIYLLYRKSDATCYHYYSQMGFILLNLTHASYSRSLVCGIKSGHDHLRRTVRLLEHSGRSSKWSYYQPGFRVRGLLCYTSYTVAQAFQ